MPDQSGATSLRKLPRQERSRALVEAILDAASRLLIERGRDAVTTNAVAVLAGVSIGSLYQYFPNRETILAALSARHSRRVHRRVAQAQLSAAATLDQALTLLVAALFAAHRLDPKLHLAHNNHMVDLRDRGVDPLHHAGQGVDELHRFSGTRKAGSDALNAVPLPIAIEIKLPDLPIAATVVSEALHAIALMAIDDATNLISSDCLEREAVRLALSYLRSSA